MLEFGKLFVTNGEGDVFQVTTGSVNEEMFLEVYLIPDEYTREVNGVDEELLLLDFLNDTLYEHLKDEGYTQIKISDIKLIQNSDW